MAQGLDQKRWAWPFNNPYPVAEDGSIVDEAYTAQSRGVPTVEQAPEDGMHEQHGDYSGISSEQGIIA